MSFFEHWPYTNFEELNIDWVLQVIKHCEETLKNLNERIETVVRPMINSQQVYIVSYFNTLKSILNGQINTMIADNKKLDAKVAKQMYQNYLAMNKLDAKVNAGLADNTAKNQLAISQLRNEINNLISKYDSIWNANSVQLNAQIQQLITQFTRDMNAQLADNLDKMTQLQLYVQNTVNTLESELNAAVKRINMDMAVLRLDVTEEMDNAVNMLLTIYDDIRKLLQTQSDNTEQMYNKFIEIVQTMYQLLASQIDVKADKSAVEAEIARLESLINKANADLIVLNPVTMTYEGLQKTLFDIYRSNNAWGLTAQEYDNIGITAEQYDQISNREGMTADGYDTLGRWYLLISRRILDSAYKYTDNSIAKITDYFTEWNQRIEKTAQDRWDYLTACCRDVNNMLNDQLYMSSPFDGITRPLKDVLLQLFGELYTKSLTAEIYDAKQLTASYYDSLGLSAYSYDWHGAELII